MIKLCFFVPVSHVDAVKEAMFTAGAGRIGQYSHCVWQTLGQGQFKPLQGSNPYVGAEGAVHTEDEFKVEMVCEESLLKPVVAALKAKHPYEEPAYEAYRVLDI